MKVLIIGYGSIGRRHANILNGLDPISSVDIVTSQTLKAITTYPTLEQVPNLNIYDYFLISSETYQHYPQLNYLNSAVSNKTILVEKPLFHTPLQLSTINNSIYVGYHLRFHPVISKLKEFLNNTLPIMATINTGQYLPSWRPDQNYTKSYSASTQKGGGVLLDLSHEIDYIHYLFGSFKLLSSHYGHISNLSIQSEDIAQFTAQSDPTFINCTINYLYHTPIRTITVYTNTHTFVGDLINHTLSVSSEKESSIIDSFNTDYNNSYQQMHENILLAPTPHACTYTEGLEVMQHIHHIKTKGTHLS